MSMLRNINFHIFLTNAKQHARTTHQNMDVMFNYLKENNHLIAEKSVVYDHTDGCSSQYRSALALYLLTILSSTFGVPIDRLFHASSHGKNEVDGLNAVTKRFLLDCMRRIVEGMDIDVKRKFESWLHKDGSSNSIAEQAVRLCNDPERKDGITNVGGKYSKRSSEKR
jgi:hypothetical protein